MNLLSLLSWSSSLSLFFAPLSFFRGYFRHHCLFRQCFLTRSFPCFPLSQPDYLIQMRRLAIILAKVVVPKNNQINHTRPMIGNPSVSCHRRILHNKYAASPIESTAVQGRANGHSIGYTQRKGEQDTHVRSRAKSKPSVALFRRQRRQQSLRPTKRKSPRFDKLHIKFCTFHKTKRKSPRFDELHIKFCAFHNINSAVMFGAERLRQDFAKGSVSLKSFHRASAMCVQ